MTKVPHSKEWRLVACTGCRNLDGDYCRGWRRRVGPPLDKAVRICKQYEPKESRRSNS